MVYTGPVIKRTSGSRGARWLRRAERLARGLSQYAQAKREIIDGYIVEGKKVGERRFATVLDVVGQIGVVGTEERVGGAAARRVVAYSYSRDDLPPLKVPPDIVPPLGDAVGTWGMYAGRLLGRDPADAVRSDRYDAFTHGVATRDDGVRVVGLTYTMTDSSGSISYYRKPLEDMYFRYEFYCIKGSGSPFDAITASRYLGLNIDTYWIVRYLGGGARLILDATSDGRGNTKRPLYGWDGFPQYYDSRGHRLVMPWVVAHPVSIEPTKTRWRVVTRYGDPLDSPTDEFSRWKLATFVVDVEFTEDMGITCTPSELVRYDPFASIDPSRVAASGDMGPRLNMFGFPAVSNDGSFLITHVCMVEGVNPGLAGVLNYSFNTVLVTLSGDIIEVNGLPGTVDDSMGTPTYGQERSLFFGGDSGVFVNPFAAPETIALVDTQTGEVSLVPRPPVQIPMSLGLAPGQRQNRLYYTDDLCRNMVGRLREGVILFPVQTASTSDSEVYALMSLDLTTGQAVILGDAPTVSDWAGLLPSPSVVQYEVIDPDTKEVISPGVILWGARRGPSMDGISIVSYDSGMTWHTISETVGPARAIWYAGSAIHAPLPGRLWNTKGG